MSKKVDLKLTWKITYFCGAAVEMDVDDDGKILLTKKELYDLFEEDLGEHWQADQKFMTTVRVTEPKCFFEATFEPDEGVFHNVGEDWPRKDTEGTPRTYRDADGFRKFRW